MTWLTRTPFLGVGFNVELGESKRASWARQEIFVLNERVPDGGKETGRGDPEGGHRGKLSWDPGLGSDVWKVLRSSPWIRRICRIYSVCLCSLGSAPGHRHLNLMTCAYASSPKAVI